MTDPKYLTIKEVASRTGLKKTTLYNYCITNKFPRPNKKHNRLSLWKEEVIDEWIAKYNTKPEQRPPHKVITFNMLLTDATTLKKLAKDKNLSLSAYLNLIVKRELVFEFKAKDEIGANYYPGVITLGKPTENNSTLKDIYSTPLESLRQIQVGPINIGPNSSQSKLISQRQINGAIISVYSSPIDEFVASGKFNNLGAEDKSANSFVFSDKTPFHPLEYPIEASPITKSPPRKSLFSRFIRRLWRKI